MPEGGGHPGLALAGVVPEGQHPHGSPRRPARMAGAAVASLLVHGAVLAALLVGLAQQKRIIDARETPATVELVMSPPGSHNAGSSSSASTQATPSRAARATPPTEAAKAKAAPVAKSPPLKAKPPAAKPRHTSLPAEKPPSPVQHPAVSKAPAPVSLPAPTQPVTKAEPAVPLPPATVAQSAVPPSGGETRPATTSLPVPPPPPPAPPMTAAESAPAPSEAAKAGVTQAPATEPEKPTIASVSPAPSEPAAQTESAPASQQKLSFNLGGIASDTNALVTGAMLMPPTADPKFHNRKPSYPPEAAKRGEAGAVVLMIHVAPDGLVSGVDIAESSGFRLLDQAAREAALTWHFLPAEKDGHPVPFDMPLRIKFSLF